MKRFIVIVSFSTLLWLAGCSTQAIKPYQPASPSVSERTAQESGVVVAVDPFVTRGVTMEYFDMDAVADGIAILHVRVENKTADRTFLVEKKNFQLISDGPTGGLTVAGKKIERSLEGGTNVEMLGAVMGGSVLYLAGLASVSQSMEIQRNFTSKELGDATVSPGKTLEGFIYFAPVKKGDDWTRAAAVRIAVTDTRTQHMVLLNIPLSH